MDKPTYQKALTRNVAGIPQSSSKGSTICVTTYVRVLASEHLGTQHFGDGGLYWFRDSPKITHWQNIADKRAWEYMVL